MSVRFRIHKDSTATLAGVEQHELRSVFDAAAVNYYDQRSKLIKKKRLSKQEREELVWVEQQLKVLQAIKGAVDAGIRATFPRRTRALTPEERREAVLDARRERRLIESLVDTIAQREAVTG